MRTYLPKWSQRRWLLVALVVLLTAWLVWTWFLRDAFDDSIIFEDTWRSRPGIVVENGRVYSQATITLPPNVELVFPIEIPPTSVAGVSSNLKVTVRNDGPAGVVTVLLEQHRRYYGHPTESFFLSSAQQGTKVWTRRLGSALTVDVPQGFSCIEGGSRVHAIFVVPPGVKVRQEPTSSPAFSGRYDEKGRWHESDENAKAAGWEEVPHKPLSYKQFR